MASESSQDIIDKIIRLHTYVLEQYDDRLEAIYKNNSMVLGDQWDEELEKKLLAQDRPVLPFNIELPFVLQVLGMQRRQPRSWKVVPFDDTGDTVIAEVIQRLLLQIANNNDLDYLDEQVFEAGLIQGVGWWMVEMNYDDDPRGDIKIRLEDGTMIFPDPDARMDNQSDWNYVVKTAWLTWERIRETWGDKVPKTPPDLKNFQRWWELLRQRLPAPLRGTGADLLVDRENNLYRVIELWERKTKRIGGIQDPITGKIHEVSSEKAFTELMNRGWMPISFGSKKYVHVTVALPHLNIVLDERDINRSSFPFVPFYPLKLAGLPLCDAISYVENLHGVQEEKNRNRSVIADKLNRTVSGGILLPPGEDVLYEDLMERGAESGYVGKMATDGKIQYLHGEFPAGTHNLLAVNDRDAQIISGLPLAQRGESESGEESGALFKAKVQQGTMTLSPIFSAFARARKLLSKVLLEFIQTEYNTQRVFRVIGEDINELIQINAQDPMFIDRILNDVTIGRYDVIITDEPNIKSARQDELKSLAEMIKVMPPPFAALIFPEIIENTDLPNRKELAGKMRALTGGNGGNIPQPGNAPPGGKLSSNRLAAAGAAM